MKKTEGQIIGDVGERIFENSLPNMWEPRKQSPDRGIDYLVEIVDEDLDYTGKEFAAQVKTTTKIRHHKGTVRFSLSTDALSYYGKRVQPVYLVVIDINKEKAYYQFLQKYVFKDLKNRDWK